MDRNFPDVSREAGVNASRALSKLVGRPAAIELSAVGVKAVADIVTRINPDERGVGVYMPVTGEVEGAALLFFAMDDAVALARVLVKGKSETSDELGELELSALKEVGNIVTGAYVTVLSNAAGVRLVGRVPALKRDTFGAVLSLLVHGIAEQAEQAVVVEVDFGFVEPTLKAYLIVLLDLAACEMVFGCVECA